jgi:hypothetical protein
MHTSSSEVKTGVINRGGGVSSWAKLAIAALAVALIAGLIAWSTIGGKKGAKSASVGGSVHHAADGGTANDTKPPTAEATPGFDPGPLNKSIDKLNATLDGLGDKVGEKMDKSNQAVIEKLDLLLAQQAKPDDDSSGTTTGGVNTGDIQMGGGDGDKPPCDEDTKPPTLDERVGALEQWGVGVDKTLKRHGRQIRAINKQLKGLGNVPVTELPGYKTATRSAVVHLKYDK